MEGEGGGHIWQARPVPRCGAKKSHHATDLASVRGLWGEWGHEGEMETDRQTEKGQDRVREERGRQKGTGRERDLRWLGPFKPYLTHLVATADKLLLGL